MKPTKADLLLVGVTLVCFVAGLWAYPRLPHKVPTHWNFRGEVDGWSSKQFGVFFFPALTLAMYVLFLYLPLLDPKRASYEKFQGAYRLIVSSVIMFMNGMYLITILAGLGYMVDVGVLVRLGVSLLFIVIGDQLARVKPNWFVGIRTPWTLSSEDNWRKTHRFGAKTMVLGGLLPLLTLPFRGAAAATIYFVLVMGGALVPVLYSYMLFRSARQE
ncbi:MAG: SdpI family protein [Bacillota bacterium]